MNKRTYYNIGSITKINEDFVIVYDNDIISLLKNGKLSSYNSYCKEAIQEVKLWTENKNTIMYIYMKDGTIITNEN